MFAEPSQSISRAFPVGSRTRFLGLGVRSGLAVIVLLVLLLPSMAPASPLTPPAPAAPSRAPLGHAPPSTDAGQRELTAARHSLAHLAIPAPSTGSPSFCAHLVVPSGGRCSPAQVPHPASANATNANWTNVSATSVLSPPQVYSPSMAYDPIDDYVVLFGGNLQGTNSGPTNQTWKFDHGNWTNLSRPGAMAPSLRAHAVLVGEPTGTLVLYGGCDADSACNGHFQGLLGPLGETWTFQNGSWSSLDPRLTDSPIGRSRASASFDVKDGYVVLTGGIGEDPSTPIADTWTLGSSAPIVTIRTNASSGPAPLWIALRAVVVRGTSPFVYSWDLGDGNTSGNGTLTHSYLRPGHYEIRLNLTDGSHREATAVFPIEVGPHLWTRLVVSSKLVDPHSAVTWNASASGGYGGFAFGYSGLPPECASLDQPSVGCFVTTPGHYRVTVTLRDWLGSSATAASDLVVGPTLVGIISVSPSVVSVGQSTLVQTNWSGGIGPIRLDFVSLPPGCAPPIVPPLLCTPSNSGNYVVAVRATDSLGASAIARANLTVIAPRPEIVLFSVTPNVTAVGSELNFRAIVFDGGATPRYRYDGLPPGCVSSNAAAFSCQPDAAGSFVVSLNVTNQYGESAATSVGVVVISKFVSLDQFAASPSPTDIDRNTTLRVNSTGGVPPYSLTFVGLPDGCRAGPSGTEYCRPPSPGFFLIEATVTDRFGFTATRTTLLVVNPALSIASFQAIPANLSLGASTVFQLSSQGGTPPFRYAYSGLPPGCFSSNASAVNCIPTGAAVFFVSATVTDAAGASVSTGASIVVTSPVVVTHPTSGAGGAIPWAYLGLGVGFTAGAILMFWVGRRRSQVRPGKLGNLRS